MSFGDRLRDARIAKGMTQEQLAAQIGVAKSTLTGYEKGNREPDLYKIKKIINVLGVDSKYLLGAEHEIEKPATNDDGLEPARKSLMDLVMSLSPEEQVRAEAYLQCLIDNRKQQ